MPDGKTILSPIQMEANGCTVVDKARGLNGGIQPYVQSREGYRFPLALRQGLMYADVRPVLKQEWDALPHVHLTSDNEWDPRIFDHEVDPTWKKQATNEVEKFYEDLPYDRFGNVKLDEMEDEETT